MKKSFATRALCVLMIMVASIVFLPAISFADTCEDCDYAIISPFDIRRPNGDEGG